MRFRTLVAGLLGSTVLTSVAHAPLPAQERGSPPPASRDSLVQLPGLLVKGRRPTCPSRSDPRAVALWTAVRARYSRVTDTASLSARLTTRTAMVPAAQVASVARLPLPPDTSQTYDWRVRDVIRGETGNVLEYHDRAAMGRGQRGMSGLWREELRLRIARDGYARPLRPLETDIGNAFSFWEYPPLEAELASHFIEPLFAQRNVLTLEGDSPGARRITFCPQPNYRRQPYIEGTLSVGADSTLARAEWRYHTPGRKHEDAGGEVVFDSAARNPEGRLLVPSMGTYYRRHSLDYYARVQVFHGWQVQPSMHLGHAWVE
jgi:hypothetical protein